MSALFSYGGIVAGGSSTSDAEIIDISGEKSFCSKPPNHPKNLRGMFGTFYHGEVIVCGGYLEEAKLFSDECYKYNGERRYLSCHYTLALYVTLHFNTNCMNPGQLNICKLDTLKLIQKKLPHV